MKKIQHIASLILILAFALGCTKVAKDENPFSVFEGKPYGDIHYALRDSLRARYDTYDPKVGELTVKQLASVKGQSGQWETEAEFFDLNFKHDHLKSLDDDDFEKGLLRLLNDRHKAKDYVWELRITRRLFDYYKGYGRLYNMAAQARRLEILFTQVNENEFPDIIDDKYNMAVVYMSLNDFDRAEKYFREVVSSSVNHNIERIYPHSRNDLGLIAREQHKDLKASDSWFLSIKDAFRKGVYKERGKEWNAIADGNLANNLVIRKDFDKAIPLLTKSFETMKGVGDMSFSLYMANSLAECYCNKMDFKEAKKWLDIANECKDESNSKSNGSYAPLAKYYCGIGNVTQSYAYMDSSAIERIKEDNNADIFLQVEREEGHNDLIKEAAKKHKYAMDLVFSSLALLLLSCLLTSIFILYKKRAKAYNELVKVHEALADSILDKEDSIVLSDDNLEDEESIMKKASKYVASSECFLNADLDIETLAHDMGVNRKYLSKAINSQSNNFNDFINSYRVSYAIKQLTSISGNSVDDVAAISGFNNRKSMYNAFKSKTGLSPSNFRQN